MRPRAVGASDEEVRGAAVNRRAAIAALLAAAPAMAQSNQIKWADAPELASEPLLVIRPDRSIEIALGEIRCLRVTMGGESVEISAAELFEALKPMPQASSYDWLIVDRPVVKP